MAESRAGQSEWDGIVGWCIRELGSRPRRRLFTTGHLAKVIGVELDDRRQVVIKLRSPDERVTGVVAVQRRLFERGFPCPEPLAGPSPLAATLATAEAFVPADQLAGRPPGRECAEMLASLVELAGDPSEFPELASPLP
jgi:hypothetical protein